MFSPSLWQLGEDMNGTHFLFFFWITPTSGRQWHGPDLTMESILAFVALLDNQQSDSDKI